MLPRNFNSENQTSQKFEFTVVKVQAVLSSVMRSQWTIVEKRRLRYHSYGRLAFAHFLHLAMISFAHYLRFQLRTIFTP